MRGIGKVRGDEGEKEGEGKKRGGYKKAVV